VRVLGVTDGDDVREVAGDFYAVSAAVAAAAGLAPARLYLVFLAGKKNPLIESTKPGV
jgi:hypothetical protein